MPTMPTMPTSHSAHASVVEQAWTTSHGYNESIPLLTSQKCYDSLSDFFRHDSQLLPICVEASSHPSGLESLYAQPWLYAGGGLGNIDECPDSMQTCLAGNNPRDSLIFASVCIIPGCQALDLLAEDFVERISTASFSADMEQNESVLREEYIKIFRRIHEVNKFLKTGWTCGEYKVPWNVFPSTIYLILLAGSIGVCFLASIMRKQKRSKSETESGLDHPTNATLENQGKTGLENGRSLFPAWDVTSNVEKLLKQRPETACLDGLKVGSILWIILGHCMAIQSSSGGGYSNPADFLPPDGLTTTFLGQLIFSSRFAVDTFLCVSGYLVVYTLQLKLPERPSPSSFLRLSVYRVIRILPLYGACLGFWILIAPHCGSGPFWYQWKNLLEPCKATWWTNLLFINNIVPWHVPTTNTCFYHSWYLAVDLQLFILLVPFLVTMLKKSPRRARMATVSLFSLSLGATILLSYFRGWSINTFDGGAVARFDAEGYAQPHIRAQAYLAGMFTAMCPKRVPKSAFWNLLLMSICIVGLSLLSFITMTGAYDRRACGYSEWPAINDCGSTWGPTPTFLYSAFGRALWSICVATIMKLCLDGRGFFLGDLLSLRLWTPLAHLSFGAYLIHPIVIFIWQLGNRGKEPYRLFTFIMNFLAVTVLSFGLAAFAALTIEFPMRSVLFPRKNSTVPSAHSNGETVSLLDQDAGVGRSTEGSYKSVCLHEHHNGANTHHPIQQQPSN